MTTIQEVDFRERLIKNSEILLECACETAEALDNGVSGFCVMAWDSSGNTAARIKYGGVISQDALPSHVFSQLLVLNARTRD